MSLEHHSSFSCAENRLVLLGVDPHRTLAYWTIHPESVELARRRLGCPEATATLRIQEAGAGEPGDPESPETFDIGVGVTEGNYYVSLGSPGRALVAEYGVRSEDGRFVAIVRSNRIALPAAGEPSRAAERQARVRGEPDPLWGPRVPVGASVEPATPEPEGAQRGPPGEPARAIPTDRAEPSALPGPTLPRTAEAPQPAAAPPAAVPPAAGPPGEPAPSSAPPPPTASPPPPVVPGWWSSIGISSGAFPGSRFPPGEAEADS